MAEGIFLYCAAAAGLGFVLWLAGCPETPAVICALAWPISVPIMIAVGGGMLIGTVFFQAIKTVMILEEKIERGIKRLEGGK